MENARQDKEVQKVLVSFRSEIFGYPLLHMTICWANEEELPMKTAGVTPNDEIMLYKPFWDRLSFEEKRGLLAHEVMHPMKGDLWRREGRDYTKWSISIDITDNWLLKQNGFHLPEGGVIPEGNEITIGNTKITEIDKKCSEVVYNLIPDEYSEDGNKERVGESSGKEGKGGGKSSQPKLDIKPIDKHVFASSDKESKCQKEKWERITRQAIVMQKERGNLPTTIESVFSDIFQEKVDWKKKLYRYITNMTIKEYTYAFPSRKSQCMGVYMPSAVREEIEIMAAMDTSGSMGQDECDEILAELIGIVKSFSNLKMRIVQCDAEVQADIPIENGHIKRLREMKVRGGGGTDFRPVYVYLKQKHPQTRLVVFFTDGYGTFPDKEIFPTLWVVTKKGIDLKDIPFGNSIKLV